MHVNGGNVGVTEAEPGTEPIIIQSDTAKTIAFLIIGVLFLLALAFAPWDGRTLSKFDVALIWFCRGGVAIYVVKMVIRLVRPQKIVLTPFGLTYSTEYRRFEFTWDDIESFEYSKGSFWAELPGTICIIRSPRAATEKKFPALMGGWPMALSELADILHGAQAKWGRRKVGA